MHVPNSSEVLGELFFNHYFIALGQKSGASFQEMRWNALTDWERESYIEAICLTVEVAVRLGIAVPSIDAVTSPSPG